MLKLFDRRIGHSSVPRILEMQIVCGDCAGDELLPIHTNLTTEGACANCGGRSFEFASLIGVALARYLRKQRKEKNNHVNSTETITTDRGTEEEPRTAKGKFRIVGRRA